MSMAFPEQVTYSELRFETTWSNIEGKQYYITHIFVESIPRSIGVITGEGIAIHDPHFQLVKATAGPENEPYSMFRIEQIKGTIEYYECPSLGVALGYMRKLTEAPFKEPKNSKKTLVLSSSHWFYSQLKKREQNRS